MSSTEQKKSYAKKRAANLWHKMKAEKPFTIDELYRMQHRYAQRMSYEWHTCNTDNMYYVGELYALAEKELAALRAQLEASHAQQ